MSKIPNIPHLAMTVLFSVTVIMVTLLLLVNSASAEGFECGTDSGYSDPLADLGIVWPYPHDMNSACVKIFVHDLIRSDGSGAMPEADLNGALEEMASAYEGIGISFHILGLETVIVPTAYLDFPWTWFQLIYLINAHEDAVDIYFLDPNWGKGGQASEVPGKALLILGHSTTDGGLIHEMGHCLGLYHTYNDNICSDYPVGYPFGTPDCENCGDLVCDTPAQMDFTAPGYYDYSTCSFTPLFWEEYGPWGYNPDPTNYMSYFFGCWDHFTQGQVNRIYAALENNVEDIGDVLLVPDAQFADVSSQTGLNFDGTPYSSISLDFDGDQKKDLFVSISENASVLNKGQSINPNGAPVFLPQFSAFSDTSLGYRGVVCADYDNDGDEDLFLSRGSKSKIFRFDPPNYVDVTDSLGIGLLADNSTCASWGDFDRDGWLDLYVVRAITFSDPPEYPDPPLATNGGLQHRLFRNDIGGGGGFTDVTISSGLGGVANLGSLSTSWVDFDQDGDQDLFVSNNQPIPNAQGGLGGLLFVNQDDGTFLEEFDSRIGVQLPLVTSQQWADIDNDNDFDLLISGDFYEPIIFFNDGVNGFLSQTPLHIGSNEGHNSLDIFDHDLDGRSDVILLSNDDQRPSRFFSNLAVLGGFAFVENTSNVGLTDLGRVLGSVATDFTNDGDPDLFLGKPLSGGKFFFKTETTGGSDPLGRNYVKVLVSSPYFANNRSGIGAVVSVTAGTLTQTQMVDGGSGRGGQNDRELTFGLGDYSSTVTATVRWPGGNLQSNVPLVISDQTSEAINIIVDDTAPIVSNVSASYVFNPATGKLDWTFSWETDVSCDPTLDKLTFDQGGIPNPCWPGWTTVTPATAFVDHSYKAKPGGGYTHEFQLHNIDCIAKCSFRYYVTSGAGSALNSCSPITKGVKVCPTAP